MNNQYKEIEFWGSNIEGAVNELLEYKEKGILACGEFNGTILHSDTVTLDDAYKSITGKSKEEFDLGIKNQQEEWEKQKREHEERIPQLTKFWTEQGKLVLDESKWELWGDIVPVRLGDLYQGMELGNCLNIIKALNTDGLGKAKELIEEQNHSGMSFSLVCAMVKEFSDKGTEFVEYVN